MATQGVIGLLRTALAYFNAYRAHPDPRVAAANTLSLVLAYNGPCYPLYLYLAIGRGFWPSLIPMWAVPAFALVPLASRRDPLAGRVLLVVLALVNTSLYVMLFSPRSEFQVFLLPSILLGLVFSHRERLLAWGLAGVPLIEFVFIRHSALPPLRPFSDAQFAAMATLNELSVATLAWFLVVLFGGMITGLLDQARAETGDAHG